MSIGSGDLVRLKSGGPQMTAGKWRGHDVDCYWFDGTGRLCSQAFPVSALVVSPDAANKEKVE